MPGSVRFFLRYQLMYALILSAVFSGQIHAQTGTTKGKEFYISMMPNASNTNDNEVKVFLTTLNDANVSIEVVNREFSQSFFMTANSSFIIDIPATYFPFQSEVAEQIGIYIEADAEISAFAINQAAATSDASMILPYASLGDNYMIHTYQVPPPQTSVTPSQFVVQATEDSTMVEINFSADITSQSQTTYTAGQTIEVELHRGEQIIYFSTGDLTGTTVRSKADPGEPCKKVAVFAGHVTTLVGEEGAPGPDHLYNQLYPVGDWGMEYVALPFETRFSGDPVKVLAAENNTTVTIDGNATITLNRGESTIFDITAPTYISASKPISVLQLTKGRTVDSGIRGNDFADPFMMALSPANQIVKELAFYMMTNFRMERHYVQVVTPTQDLSVFVNDQDYSDRFSLVPGNPTYSHASFSLNPGFYTMSSPNGFVAHAYAFGEAESIGYALGGDLGDFDVEVIDPQFGEVTGGNFTGTVCEASDLTFRVTSEIDILKQTYTQFQWDMGNGDILYGDEVTYKFPGPGSYPVRMTASKGSNLCNNLFVDRLIEVVPDGVEGIEGPESVCPDVQDILYTVVGDLPDYTYQWFVDGGTIDGSDKGLDVVVDWSINEPNARVRVLATSPTGCLSDTVDLPIVLNEFLQPAIPRGSDQLCSVELGGIVYTTPNATGSVYTWEVEGGTIDAGQGTNTVSVTWDGVGVHSIWYGESTTTTSSLCDGVSPKLEVTVYEPLLTEASINLVSCFGEPDGTATMNSSGGLAPYAYQWSSGDTGPAITQKTAGSYTVTVTDDLGCELVETVVIAEPPVLSGFMDVQDAVCNGERGFAIAQVEGGTAPYVYDWSTGVTTSSSQLDGLSRGSYSVRITDVNNCEINLNFSLEEPAALEAEFTMEQACPGVPDGSLALTVSGGVAPYTYNWEFNPAERSNLLGELTDGTYKVTVIDGAGCELELTGLVTNESPVVRFPTAFSPNGDGVNDKFEAVFNCALDFNMVVYNRWGNVVFFSRSINEGWDGNFEGKPAPPGTYTYDISYGGVLNGMPFTETVRGIFRLMR
ncbi:MAG: T9SS type B sorting domain-containing protein [Roseivirga sp.]|nr:T9SS type B sorting domain-containing protein [Roseivirga sp.]